MPEVTAGDAHLALCAAVRGHLMPEVTAGTPILLCVLL